MENTPENWAIAADLIGQLECLPRYPRTDNGVVGLVRSVMKFVADKEKLEWLIDKVLAEYTLMPSPAEMRETYRQKYPPADGIE